MKNILLVALFITIFNGCGGAEEDTKKEIASDTEKTVPKIVDEEENIFPIQNVEEENISPTQNVEDENISPIQNVEDETNDSIVAEDTQEKIENLNIIKEMVAEKEVVAESFFDESLRGEWIYIHNNTKVYIDENFNENIIKVDDKLIQVEKDGTSYYLMRQGTNHTVVKGNLYEESSTINKSIARVQSRLAGHRIGGMKVILKHYTDKKNDKEEIADETGKFKFQNVQTGRYTLVATQPKRIVPKKVLEEEKPTIVDEKETTIEEKNDTLKDEQETIIEEKNDTLKDEQETIIEEKNNTLKDEQETIIEEKNNTLKDEEQIIEKENNIISEEEIVEEDENPTVEADVYIHGEEITLGGFKLVSDDGYNYKTEFVIENSDSGYLFANQTIYRGKMIINNIGNKEGTGLNYTFTSDSPYIQTMNNDIVLGTIEAGQSKEIPFSISFNILDKNSVNIPLEVKIKDANNNEWFDTVFLQVYQTPMYLNIATKEANVKGYIIEDGHNLKKIDTSGISIILPYKVGEKYFLVLTNPSINNETPYSIGIDTDTLDFSTFQNTGIYEPNNSESEATTIKMNESILSYLHKGDIDYFIIDMTNMEDIGKFSPPQMPFR